MTLYSIALFIHIVGALLLFVLLTIEGNALRQGFMAARLNQILGPISALTILVPGLYMVASEWGAKGWVVVGIAAWVLIAVAGAVTGISLLRGRLDGANRRAVMVGSGRNGPWGRVHHDRQTRLRPVGLGSRGRCRPGWCGRLTRRQALDAGLAPRRYIRRRSSLRLTICGPADVQPIDSSRCGHNAAAVPIPSSLLDRDGALLVIAARTGQELAGRRLAPMGLTVRLCGVLNLLAEGPISQQELGEQRESTGRRWSS